MLKWIGGIALLLAVLLVSGLCYGYNKMQKFAGDDGPATTMVGAPLNRVFALLATGDSVPEWMSVSGSVRPSRHGPLAIGDTLTVIGSASSEAQRRAHWIVTELTPGRLLVLQMRGDSLGVVMASRRFALEARGDSTAIISTVASPAIDSVKAARRDSSVMMGFASKMMLAALRMQSKVELGQLKSHLEGGPASAATLP
jgi:uncharacterized protein YndB with AHSA1/START domain